MAMRLTTPAELTEAYKLFIYNPALWVEYILGVSVKNGAKKIDKQVKEILDSVGKLFEAKDKQWTEREVEKELQQFLNKKGISTRAGQGTGKDTANAWIMLWLGDCWPNAKVIVTAPKLDQVKTILWNEVRKWLNKENPLTGEKVVPEFIRRKYDISAETIKFIGGNGFCQIMTCPKDADPDAPSTSMFGQHDDVMIVIVTEADGVQEGVLNALISSMTGPINFAMMAFNPRRTSGYAYKTHCDVVERKKWIALHHSAEKSSLVSASSLEDKLSHGRDSNYYRVFALGEFPIAETDAIIKWEHLLDAVEKEIEVPEDYPFCDGIDPAGAGKDKTILTRRQMGRLMYVKEINASKRQDTKDELLDNLSRRVIDRKYIDKNGLGYYLYTELFKEIANLRGVESQGAARNKEKFANKRAEMWFNCAEAFEKGLISIPDNDRLKSGLSSARWKREQNKLQVVSKKDIKKQIGHSPDEAEAFVMTFADGFEYYKEPESDGEYHRKKNKTTTSKSFMGV